MPNAIDAKMQALAGLLVQNGLENAFGITGSGLSLSLITALENLGVHYHPASHEAAATIMAGVVSRVSGKVSASISIKGPGFANMLPGIVFNNFENNPALSISEDFSSNIPPFRKHKRLNHTALLAPIAKGIISQDNAEEQLPALLELAREEAPGPVHLNLGVKAESIGLSEHRSIEAVPDSASNNRSKTLQHIRDSQRPILVLGSLATRQPWTEHLASLKIPVFTTASAKGVVDEGAPHSAGVFTGDGKSLALESHLFSEADLVIGLGLRNTEILVAKPFGKPTILVDMLTSDRFEDLGNGFQADLFVNIDNSSWVESFFASLMEKSWGLEQIAELLQTQRKALLNNEWLPAHCFDAINRLDGSHGMVLDTGSFCTIGEHLWLGSPQRTFLGSSNARYMAVGLPSAIGLAVARPGLPVFCAVGDGGIRMYIAEIKLAVQENLPLCLLLMSDGQYGSIACAPNANLLSQRAVKIQNPSWWRSVEAMGCPAVKVESQDSFAEALNAWDQKSPLFVEAVFDPHAYGEMTAQLR